MSTTLVAQVSLRRLLHRCEQRIEKERENQQQLQTSPQFHHCVETLKQTLGDLETQETASGKELSDELKSLRSRVQSVADFLGPERKADYCRMVSRAPTAGVAVSNTSMMQGVGSRLGISSMGKGLAQAQAGPSKQVQLGAVGENLIRRQKQLQEELTDEMVSMAAGLKSNSLMLEEELRQSSKVLDSTHDLMSGNLDATVNVKKTAVKQYSVASRGSCMMWLMMLAVGILFTFTALFIRVFSVKNYQVEQV
mmetsp:Transcript_1377/g.1594  ORF Transcript_1377/g.1594 Transcript_1377/m.1594 type:complete len:252 (-) Transcript_1377:288-1043(-)|eukprot:CAMPEP_0197853350 /NCGR_PEP_ID=MMETSP1438-20131217/22556_1 /TAXON_ID=1461541 /ORGANISM="Pterosperma sp., Strain CCMP1384" /LENGTH=251 /DNA_ID=CAMNT_0043467729 /DNA_START=315 /DNA_END=1070 /DNA_ORIENTATION=-